MQQLLLVYIHTKKWKEMDEDISEKEEQKGTAVMKYRQLTAEAS